MATRTISPSDVQQNEALRRTAAPASKPTRLIAAGIKNGRGTYTLRTAVTR
ncbi:hypothetical protein ACWGH4_00445 [Streptomyces sp. NPDC054847]